MLQSEIKVELREWPVVHVQFVGAPDEDAFRRYLEHMDDIVARPGDRVLIYDASETTSISATQRKMKAEWVLRNRLRIAECTRGLAFVLPNAFARGALTAILWISPMPAPYVVVGTVEQAQKACDGWLGRGRAASG